MLVTAQFPPGLCFGLKTLIDCGDCGAFRTAMAILAGQGPEEMKITVRNTFLNVLDDEEDPLFRTSSDPLGGQCEMQARHIAKAKQATSSKLFTHDESNETNETASTTLEDVALCRSRTWDPLEPHFIEASQDGSPTDVSESPTACPLQVGATAPGMMPTTMPVVRSPAPSVTSPFAGGLAFLNSQPSDLSPFTAPWQPPKMTALAHPFIPSERSNFDANQQLFFPSSLIHQEADVGRDVDDSQMKDRGRKGYGKGSKGKEKGDQFGSRAYSFSSNGKGRMPAVHRSQDPSRGYSSAKEAIVLESSRPMVSSKGPQFAFHHRFHPETAKMGSVSPDHRTFTKEQYMGRLSVITEDRVHKEGIQRYVVQFCSGELSNADGVGFIFSNKLPCPKNIQKIVSIFANKTGRLCMRAFEEVVRSEITVKPLDLGDWIELEMDLENGFATFTVWPVDGSMPSSATLNFGSALNSIRRVVPSIPECLSGYMAVVVKHTDVAVTLAS